jgi:hypothetical protein
VGPQVKLEPVNRDDDKPTALRLARKASMRVESAEKDRDGSIRRAAGAGASIDEIAAATDLPPEIVARIVEGQLAPAWCVIRTHEMEDRSRYRNDGGCFFVVTCSCGDRIMVGPMSASDEAEAEAMRAWGRHLEGG